MQIGWKLRMVAAQRGVWTGAQLQRLLADRAGLGLSSASVSAMFPKQPSQIKLSTLIALCTALECTPNDLFDIDTTPVAQPISSKPADQVRTCGSPIVFGPAHRELYDEQLAWALTGSVAADAAWPPG